MTLRRALLVVPPLAFSTWALLRGTGFSIAALALASRGVWATVDAVLPRSVNVGGVMLRAPAMAAAARLTLVLGQITLDILLVVCMLAL